MFSVVYTPTEGDAIQNFSRLFRRPEGCFLNIDDVDRVRHDLSLWGKPEDIDYIVVTGNAPRHTGPWTRHAANSSKTARKSSALAIKVAAASLSRWPSWC